MKKFTFKGVLDGIRSSVAPQIKPEQEIVETLRSDNFQVAKTFRHGFPYQPTALAFDPIQRLLAIGTKNGSLRIIGRPGVDAQVRHELEAAVVQVEFLMNEGALITVTADDSLHLWNFRQKRADVVHSLKFQRERITVVHLPLRSKWLYVGSERGNVHFVNVELFTLSGYIINWNKAIEVTRPTHPGPIVHLSDNPADSSKLLIGFETGLMVLWDLKTKKPECRWQWGDSLKSIDWHFEGKQFTCSHSDGSLTTWNVKPSSKPANIIYPHAKTKTETCKPIQKVEWKSSKSGESYLIFSGGLTADTAGRVPSITIMHGKTTTVLEMDHNIVDFVTLCESPYNSDVQEPYAIAVLMQNDLVLVDLLSPGYPCFENPHPMDIHESPVSCVHYIADCPSDLIPAFYSVGSRSASKRTGYSENKWPIAGGEWSPTSCSYNEIILTGHTDGSVRFWDASAGSLQVLYKLKTAKVFEKSRSKSPDGAEDDQFSVQLLSFCPESRKLAVAGSSSYVVLFKFRKLESTFETTTLEIPIYTESLDEAAESSPEETPSKPATTDDSTIPVKVRTGPQKKPPGFQACLACVTPSVNGEPPGQITALTINSSYGLLAYGLDNGIVIVDFIQKHVLLNINTAELYGSADPNQRAPRSPKRTTAFSETSDGERCRSPSIDQEINETRESCPDHKIDKLDSSFSRSRSSSMSSLDNITTETIQCLTFGDSYTKKSDPSTFPTLWIGTSVGSVLTIMINLPPSGEPRTPQSVSVAPCGTIFRLKGGVLTTSFLDCNGALIPYAYEAWRDEGRDKQKTPTKNPGGLSRMSPALTGSSESVSSNPGAAAAGLPQQQQSQVSCDRQFVTIVSEKQARVVALPSQNCVYKHQIADADFVVKSEVVSVKDSVCLACYISNGHINIFSLPSLRLLVDVDFLALSDLSFQTQKQGIVDPMLSIWGQQMFVNEDTDQIAKTFCFSNRGHGLFLNTPSELQRFSVSAEFCQSLPEMMGELFQPHEMPEPPKQSFFIGLFGGGSRSIDREELFGESSSGKAPKLVAKHIPGPSAQLDAMGSRASTAASEISRAHQLALERGEKLSNLEDRTARMMTEADQFSSNARELLLKNKDKRWYQL
ncbi:syntaxin-binding protein 5 isoform X3 [Adelges cooleyi]|uniref:syntaxin-binding protein 5 isoform X3 n=1 Tax=Adelges cooleyi TaxID=133065 RepID=UPI00218020DE|nr:syntaxin-binding protein 5 isoform X3 [Adelges cooleyi]